MKQPQFYLLLGFLLLALGTSCSTNSSIQGYTGDGEFKEGTSYGVGTSRGYSVKFAPVKLDAPVNQVYHFSGLPRRSSDIFFVMENRALSEVREQLTGTCAITLKDGSGKIVRQFKKKFCDMVWVRAGDGPWELYDSQTVYFTPDRRDYILELAIDTDPLLKDEQGYVFIRGGVREGI